MRGVDGRHMLVPIIFGMKRKMFSLRSAEEDAGGTAVPLLAAIWRVTYVGIIINVDGEG
jgi:hypothetical protein